MAEPAKRHRAAPEERVSRSPSRKALQVECERCGQQMSIERAGRFRDDDYIELWHEHMALQRELADRRELIRTIKALHDRIFRLEAGITWRDGEIAVLKAQLEAISMALLDKAA